MNGSTAGLQRPRAEGELLRSRRLLTGTATPPPRRAAAMPPTTRIGGKRKSLDADPESSWFCRKQSCEADIPILPVNITGGATHLEQALLIARRREEIISPFRIAVGGHSIHVTPLPNPITSHHILQFYSSSFQEVKIDALIEDATVYFTAFRRRVRQRTRRTGDLPLGPSPWYVFSDQMDSLPGFLRQNAVKIGMGSSYTSPILVGGNNYFMLGILKQLAYFDADTNVIDEFKAAMYALMAIYCETRRSRGMKDMVVLRRMEESEEPSELPPKQDKTKNMWKSFSGEAIELKRQAIDLMRQGKLGADKPLPAWCKRPPLDFEVQGQLIGENRELLLAKQDAGVLRDHVTQKRFDHEALKAKRRSPALPNPMFSVPVGFIPDWLLVDWSPMEREALGFSNPPQ